MTDVWLFLLGGRRSYAVQVGFGEAFSCGLDEFVYELVVPLAPDALVAVSQVQVVFEQLLVLERGC